MTYRYQAITTDSVTMADIVPRNRWNEGSYEDRDVGVEERARESRAVAPDEHEAPISERDRDSV